MSGGVFMVHGGREQTLPRLVNADHVAAVREASGTPVPNVECINTTIVLANGAPIECGEPFEIVFELWSRALHDTRGLPGYWKAIPPGPNEKPHPSNPSAMVIGDPEPWKVERVNIKGNS